MFYDRFKPSINIYIISSDKVFSNQLLLKLEDDTDSLVIQDDSAEEFFQEIQKNPIAEETIPIVIVDFKLQSIDNQNAKDGDVVMREIKTVYPTWEVIIMTESSETKLKDDSENPQALYHLFKNDNTGARIVNRIHQIQNSFYLEYKRKMVLYSLYVLLTLTSILILSRTIFYWLD